jgi:hypothetical protein
MTNGRLFEVTRRLSVPHLLRWYSKTAMLLHTTSIVPSTPAMMSTNKGSALDFSHAARTTAPSGAA